MSDAANTGHEDNPSSTPHLVSRLIGMETEYPTLILDRPELGRGDLPASRKVFDAICEEIRKEQPTAVGVFDSEQMFLASGGAVSFETHPALQSLPGGLIEIATPEVNSPQELLACQRAMDELVADAASHVELEVDLRVLKNSADALGHVYGCQENYEAEVASGLWLLLYRISIVILWGMQLVSLIVSLPVLLFLFGYVALSRRIRGQPPATMEPPSQLFESLPGIIKWFVLASLRLIHFPTVVVLRLVVSKIAFRPQRRYLTAMLASRVALCGTGDLDFDGRFRISAKAMAIDTVSHMGSYRGERPIFVFGHWLSIFCAKSFISLAATRRLLRKQQRLQIGLSDSNLCDLAEYVKVGSVSLVLDMIEARATAGLPTLKRPIWALHKMARDWNLVTRVDTDSGKLSALEIQKKYLEAAREFVASIASEQRGEAELVLERWQELFDAVAAYRKDAHDLTDALGRVDWLSKRWMIDQIDDLSWTVRKKTDLRYHELSEDGYYRRLAKTKPELQLVSQEHIDRRRRSPPSESPAARRAWIIREFSGSDEMLQSEWTYAILGHGRERKRMPFERKENASS